MSTRWGAVTNVPVRPVNQIAVQLGTAGASGPEGIYVTFGHAAPPLLTGDSDEQRAQLAVMGNTVEVEVLGRYQLSRDRVGELIKLLQHAADFYDQAEGGS